MSELIFLKQYDGQTVEDLIALEDTHRIDSLVCAFEEALWKKANRNGLESLTEEEYIVLEPKRPRQADGRPPRGVDKSSTFQRADGQGPTAVVFHDSFMQQLAPFLSEHFAEAHYVWTREFRPEVILRHTPQVVIQEYGERLLQADLPTNPTDLTVPPNQRWAKNPANGGTMR